MILNAFYIYAVVVNKTNSTNVIENTFSNETKNKCLNVCGFIFCKEKKKDFGKMYVKRPLKGCRNDFLQQIVQKIIKSVHIGDTV